MSEGYAPTTPLDSDHEGAGEPPDEEPPSGSAGPTGPIVLLLVWLPRQWRDRLPLLRLLDINIKHFLLKIDEKLSLLEKKYKIYRYHQRRAEAGDFQEVSRPAPTFVDAGVETDIKMGDFVTQMEYVQLVDSIEATHIPREEHQRALAEQETNSQLNAHHRVQRPVYFTQHGRCWHADYFCVRGQASTRIHQREFCTRCCQTLGTAMAPQDWERDL
ncbi:unnamed protein product [Cladocopium goreaui]|uniref:Uncharacterized protein n=1 Tax=Cladocopium goreaui TaxID=2562237 RepID=A0A9P1CTK9_9DINO|nr:unnamed protein product [Cladocopium goreaui]